MSEKTAIAIMLLSLAVLATCVLVGAYLGSTCP